MAQRRQSSMRVFVAIVGVILVSACSSARETTPQRSAMEQMLISSAAERAANRLDFQIPQDSKVFVDSSNLEGYDAKYAIAAVRDRVLRQGGRLVADRATADTIVEPRAGALSIDEYSTLFGIPSMELPIPLAGPLKTPELALFKKHEFRGVANFASSSHDAKTGALIQSISPVLATSHKTRWVVFFISWTTEDMTPVPQ